MGKKERLESLVMAAAKGEPMPMGATPHDKILYDGLQALYELYSLGWVTKEEGARRKQQLIMEWEAARNKQQLIIDWEATRIEQRLGTVGEAYINSPNGESEKEALYKAMWAVAQDWKRE